MAIIDELRSEKQPGEIRTYDQADRMIKWVVSELTNKVRYGMRDMKDISCKGTILEKLFCSSHPVYSIGRPQYYDPDEWISWRLLGEHGQDEAEYMVPKLKAILEKEFRPQKLTVRYDSHKRKNGFFSSSKYYTIYLDVLIKI